MGYIASDESKISLHCLLISGAPWLPGRHRQRHCLSLDTIKTSGKLISDIEMKKDASHASPSLLETQGRSTYIDCLELTAILLTDMYNFADNNSGLVRAVKDRHGADAYRSARVLVLSLFLFCSLSSP